MEADRRPARDLPSGSSAPNQIFSGARPHALTEKTVGTTTLAFEYDADGNLTRRDRAGATTQYLDYTSQGLVSCVKTSPAGGCSVAEFGYDLSGAQLYEKDGAGNTRIFVGAWAIWDSSYQSISRISAFGREIALDTRSTAIARVAEDPPLALPPVWRDLLLATALALSLLALAWLASALGLGEALIAHPVRLPATLAFSLVLAWLPVPARAGGPPGPPDPVIRWVFANGVGSGVVYTSDNPTVVRRRVFEPFGRVVAEAGTESPDVSFTGKLLNDDAQLYAFGARWYDAETGQFTAVDPIVADAADPKTHNGYAYVGGDPANFVDPTGMESAGNPPFYREDSNVYESLDAYIYTDPESGEKMAILTTKDGEVLGKTTYAGIVSKAKELTESSAIKVTGGLGIGTRPTIGTFAVPVIPGEGTWRAEFFIASKTTLGGMLKGDGRDFDPAPNPSDSRAFFTLDFESGQGFFQINPSCLGDTGVCFNARGVGKGNTFVATTGTDVVSISGSLQNSADRSGLSPAIDFGITFYRSAAGVRFDGWRNGYPSLEITRDSQFVFKDFERTPYHLIDRLYSPVRVSGP